MEEQVVNESAEISVAESTPAEDQSVGSEEKSESAESAETLNTEKAETKTESHVPYDRFKSVNEKYKEAKEQLDALKPLQEFETLLNQDEKLYKQVEEYLTKTYGQGEVQQEVDEVGQLRSTVTNLVRQTNISKYQAEFDKMTDGMNDAQRAALERLTDIEMYRLSSAPYDQYNPKALKKAFEAAKQVLDPLIANGQAELVNEKSSESVPATSSTGAPVKETETYGTQEERSAALAKLLKQAKSGG
jgi:hypothetical protein